MAELERTLWEELRESNENRVAALEAKTNGQQSLDNAFDALRILTFVEQIAVTVQCVDEAELAFETKRADMLCDIEERYEQMMAAKEAAERQQTLTNWTGPNRQQRRHPGPSGIVR